MRCLSSKCKSILCYLILNAKKLSSLTVPLPRAISFNSKIKILNIFSANNKLAEMLRNHQAEVTKLKAQLKKEEISRASVNEQLIQKSKENAELVKICDELIGNHGQAV